jgi:thiol-disulfide isomerase/thioredoxin
LISTASGSERGAVRLVRLALLLLAVQTCYNLIAASGESLANPMPGRSLVKLILTIVIAIAVTAPASSMQGSQSATSNESIQLKALPPIALQDFDGKTVPAEKFKDKIVVLDFWATWCGPCLAEIPELNRLQEKYGDKGVKVVGVTMASGEAKEVKPFIARNKMKYTVLMGDDDQAYDFNVVAFPTTYLLTKDLKIFRRYIGAGPRKAAQIEGDIQKLLAMN